MAGSTGEALLVHEGRQTQQGLDVNSGVRKRVVSYFLRFECLEDSEGSIAELNHLMVNRISKEARAPRSFVVSTVGRLLTEVEGFNQFLRSGLISWNANGKSLFRKVRVYLRKTHKIVPAFDYPRAVRNLESLHAILNRKFYWPHIATQLALIIFVTDRNDPSLADKNYILQKNLRTLCGCSAYAFHRARNKLGIDKEGRLVNQ
jgi:hypothetical protein